MYLYKILCGILIVIAISGCTTSTQTKNVSKRNTSYGVSNTIQDAIDYVYSLEINDCGVKKTKENRTKQARSNIMIGWLIAVEDMNPSYTNIAKNSVKSTVDCNDDSEWLRLAKEKFMGLYSEALKSSSTYEEFKQNLTNF